MQWLGLTAALLRRRILGMSVAEFGQLASSDPAAAASIIRAAGDILFATGQRLISKADTATRSRRAARIRRRGEQRLTLAKLAWEHAQDLMYLAEGESQHCKGDPLRKPLI